MWCVSLIFFSKKVLYKIQVIYGSFKDGGGEELNYEIKIKLWDIFH